VNWAGQSNEKFILPFPSPSSKWAFSKRFPTKILSACPAALIPATCRAHHKFSYPNSTKRHYRLRHEVLRNGHVLNCSLNYTSSLRAVTFLKMIFTRPVICALPATRETLFHKNARISTSISRIYLASSFFMNPFLIYELRFYYLNCKQFPVYCILLAAYFGFVLRPCI
jgi:hypothetical protein